MSRMLQEIAEQPVALDRTFKKELATAKKLKAAFASKRPRLIVLAARGTSDNAAQFGRYLLEITTGIPVSLAAPSISTLYKATLEWQDTLCVAISQSGESTDTNVVLEDARRAGAMTIGITNEAGSSLAGLADHVILVRANREKSVAATKTYTGQLMAFYLLAWALGSDIELESLARIGEWVNDVLQLQPAIQSLAERYTFMEHAVVVGRGLNYANAFEFALKLMETCYVIAERFSSADFLHGPIAMVESQFPVFLFAPEGVTWPGMRDMITQLCGLGAELTIITDAGNSEAARLAPRAIEIPVVLANKRHRPVELYTPIPYVVPAQLFAACLAERKGLNPDEPRTIQKVTRTL